MSKFNLIFFFAFDLVALRPSRLSFSHIHVYVAVDMCAGGQKVELHSGTWDFLD